jgi:hypothetical protein
MATGAAVRRTTRDDGYGRSSRFYTVEGKQFPSVTSILQAVAKPALVNWAANTERDMVMRAACDLWEDVPVGTVKMSRMAYEETLRKRVGTTKAHAKELAKAGDLGSKVHALIEWNMRRELLQEVGPEPVVPPIGTWAFMAYEDWRKAANLAPAFVEQTVYSLRYGYAGTADWGGDMDDPSSPPDGKSVRISVVGDWKISKGIYAEALLQNAAYVHALVEMGHATPGTAGCIVRLPKLETDPEFEVRIIPAEEQKRLFKAFLAVMDVWKWMEEENGRRKAS